MKLSALELDLGTVTMSCTTNEVAATLAALLREMRLVLPRLREDEREVLRHIMSRDSGSLTVGHLFPDFARESEAHKTLRRLRAAQFVRPALTGRWDLAEPIEVKPFARLMWDHVGEAEIFAGSDVCPMAAPAEEAPAAEAAPAAGEEPAGEEELAAGEEPAVVEAAERPAAAWDDDDVLDLREYDDLRACAEEELRGKA
jgi:hypothetical protein